MSSPPIKSTVTVSNEQRPVVLSNTIQSTRTVVESVNATSSDHSGRFKKKKLLKDQKFIFIIKIDRRLSGSDRKRVNKFLIISFSFKNIFFSLKLVPPNLKVNRHQRKKLNHHPMKIVIHPIKKLVLWIGNKILFF